MDELTAEEQRNLYNMVSDVHDFITQLTEFAQTAGQQPGLAGMMMKNMGFDKLGQ